MSSAATPVIPLPSPQRKTPAQLPMLVALGAVVLAFAPTLISFPPAWLTRGGQGFVAAGFALYLLWRDRHKLLDFRAAVPEVSLVVAGLSMLWLVAFVLNVQVVHQASVPLVLLSWLLAVGGVRPALAALPITAVFFLAVPVWGVLTSVLQGMTIFVNGLLLSVAGIEAVIRGENIAINAGVFWVAQGCAGLNYFETSLLISVIYALLFLTQWRYRFMAMGVAVALALVSNWLRVFGLIVIGHVTNMQSSLISEHALYGWLIFAVAMVIFFALTRNIENRDHAASVGATSDNIASNASTATRATGAPRNPAASRTARAPRTLSSATVALPTMAAVIGPVLFFALGGRGTGGTAPAAVPGIAVERSGDNVPVLVGTADGLIVSDTTQTNRTDSATSVAAAAAAFDTATSANIGDTSDTNSVATATAEADSTRRPVRLPPPWRPLYKGADQHQIMQYSIGTNTVRVDRLIYEHQGQGKELISGLNIIAAQEHRLSQQTIGPLNADGRMMNTTIVRTPEGARLVWHWFSVAGSVTHSTTRAKLLELIAFARSKSPPAELVTVSTLCEPDNCTAANQTLYQFVLGEPLPSQ